MSTLTTKQHNTLEESPNSGESDVNSTATQWSTEVEQPWQPPVTEAKDQTLNNNHATRQTHIEHITEVTPENTVKQRTESNSQAAKPLTRKQKAFADYLLANPKASATTAAKATYNVTTDGSARIQAHDTLTKPNVQIYMAIHADKALTDMIEIAEYSKKYGRTGTRDGASYAGVAVSINRDILDRVHGKATQRTEVISKKVSVSIDLTGKVIDTHASEAHNRGTQE